MALVFLRVGINQHRFSSRTAARRYSLLERPPPLPPHPLLRSFAQVLEVVAAARGEDPGELAALALENTRRVFFPNDG